MNISKEPLIIGNKDETFSYSGKKDFATEEAPEIKTVGPAKAPTRPRTRKSEINSYT